MYFRLFEIRGKTWLDWQLPCPSLSLSLSNVFPLHSLFLPLYSLSLSLYLLSSPPPISAASIYSRLLFRSTFSLHLLCRYLVFATVVAGGDCEEELSKQWWGRAVELILPIFNHRGTYLFHPHKAKGELGYGFAFSTSPLLHFFWFFPSLWSLSDQGYAWFGCHWRSVAVCSSLRRDEIMMRFQPRETRW